MREYNRKWGINKYVAQRHAVANLKIQSARRCTMKLHALIHEAKRDLYGMWMVRVWVGALDGICQTLWFFGRVVR